MWSALAMVSTAGRAPVRSVGAGASREEALRVLIGRLEGRA